MRKYKKQYSEEIQKNNKSEKRMLKCRKMAKNWLRRFKNTKKLKFDSISLTGEGTVDQKKSI